jgi:hypothetical protein
MYNQIVRTATTGVAGGHLTGKTSCVRAGLTPGGCILAGPGRDLPHWSTLQSRRCGVRQEVGELLQKVVVALEQVGNLAIVPPQKSHILRSSLAEYLGISTLLQHNVEVQRFTTIGYKEGYLSRSYGCNFEARATLEERK